jgi:hypothetical protein
VQIDEILGLGVSVSLLLLVPVADSVEVLIWLLYRERRGWVHGHYCRCWKPRRQLTDVRVICHPHSPSWQLHSEQRARRSSNACLRGQVHLSAGFLEPRITPAGLKEHRGVPRECAELVRPQPHLLYAGIEMCHTYASECILCRNAGHTQTVLRREQMPESQ